MISRETLKARYIRHLQTGQFDLSIKFPENDENSSRYDLFDWPYMVFVPETEFYKIKTANKLLLRPQCINRDCHCTPVFFKHCYRLITTLSGVVALIYAHWTCADSRRSRNTSSMEVREGSTVELSSTDMGLVGSPTSFSTLSEEYMDKLPLNMRQQLEFVFSKKGGMHIDFMTAVLHPAMLTVGPALGTAEHTKTMTAKYFKTLRKASGWRHQPVALDESLARTDKFVAQVDRTL
ncbi:hypothetical protein BDR26DRAFT_946693 [Obelidium mucronatum]|nr:hypothetical protein BDR26DRAFT_946693 [Obelidium mucronatum]